MEIVRNHRKSIDEKEIYGNYGDLWKSIDINGSQCKSVETNRNLWESVEIDGDLPNPF